VLVRHNRWRWFGHVERKFVNDWVNKCRQLVVEAEAGDGEVEIHGWIVLVEV